jgi:hypothetical protein
MMKFSARCREEYNGLSDKFSLSFVPANLLSKDKFFVTEDVAFSMFYEMTSNIDTAFVEKGRGVSSMMRMTVPIFDDISINAAINKHVEKMSMQAIHRDGPPPTSHLSGLVRSLEVEARQLGLVREKH